MIASDSNSFQPGQCVSRCNFGEPYHFSRKLNNNRSWLVICCRSSTTSNTADIVVTAAVSTSFVCNDVGLKRFLFSFSRLQKFIRDEFAKAELWLCYLRGSEVTTFAQVHLNLFEMNEDKESWKNIL
jgi:hypothetical protein